MRRLDAMATKLSKDELRILLHSYIRDQTGAQLLDRYTEQDAKQFISLKEKLITMVEVATEDEHRLH